MKKLKFDEAIEKLEELAQQLESGSFGLEDAVKAYEKGILLAAECQKLLTEAESKIEQLSEQPDGTLKTVPIELDDEKTEAAE